jgi:hypothetical protein
MKRYLLLFGAVILVMALASPCMAQFKSWGHLEIQTIYEVQPDFNTGGNTSSSGVPAGQPNRDLQWKHVAERFRFYLQYGDPKTVRAVLGFEADSTDWGQKRPTNDTPYPTGGHMGGYTADSVQLEIKWAFVDFVVPHTPISVTAGIQPFAVGGRLLLNNDGAGVTVDADFAPHKITAAWLRIYDDTTPTSTYPSRAIYDVTDFYYVSWDMTKPAYKLSAFVGYLNDLASGWQANEVFRYGGLTLPIINHYDDHPIPIGVSGGFNPGNWNFYGNFIYVTGKREFKQGNVSDPMYQAYAGEISAKYRIGPGLFAGIEGFYASGNDSDTDNIHYYPTAQSSEARSIFGNDRTVFMWMNAAQMGYYHNHDIDFSGMWYGRANVEYSPLAWLRMNLNYLYIGDTSSGSTGTTTYPIGSVGPKIVNSPVGSRQDADKNDVGQEINLITTLTIYKNFVYNIGLYYFIPGSVFDLNGKDAENSYGINTKLVYAF